MTESLEQIDVLIEEDMIDDALALLTKMERNPEVQWRLAAVMYHAAHNIENVEERRAKILEALELAKASLACNAESAEAAKYAAILAGTAAEFEGASSLEQMKRGAEFKKLLDTAIALSKEPDMSLLHARGRFSYKVASLAAPVRLVACGIFGTLPTCTYQEALDDLLASEEISPSFDTLHFIGLCYVALGNKDKAREYFTRVIEDESAGPTDIEWQGESRKALDQL